MLKELIQTTEPKIYISVFDDYADCSDDATTQVYYFDWENGVCEETVSALMMYSNPYAGQQLVVEVKDIIPKILRPLMDEAIEAGDAQCINRLAEAMVYVLTELQTQEAGDVN